MSNSDILDHHRKLIEQAVLRAYVSVREPRYFFKDERIHAPEIDGFVSALSENYDIEETTDLNVDCSRVFALTCAGNEWILWRSLVGPFVAIVRLESPDRRVLVRSSDSPQAPPGLATLLESQGCILLEACELAAPIPLAGVSALNGEVSTFAALFSDCEYLPWERPR